MGNGTQLGRVRGLGSSKHGTSHWFQQRLTAGANIGLMLWLVISVARLPAYDYATMVTWLSSAWAAIPMLLLIVSVFWHFRLGLTVLIEDYLHDETRVLATVALTFFTVVTSTIAIFAILRIAFAGVPA